MREGTVTLAEGRRLGYVEMGPPDGVTVMYCHGSPSCRLEPTLAEDALGSVADPPRVIALDRPGYGLSDYLPGRGFGDWPADVAAAADLLDVDRFSVIGASGGAPYALACAAKLGDRVDRVAIVVGVAPPEAPGMANSLIFTGPSKYAILRRIEFGLVALGFKRGKEERVLDQSIATLGHADREAMGDPRMRTWFGALFRELLAQGGRGAAYEVGLYRRPWGFELADVAQEVRLWYAGKDGNVPVEAGRWMADRLPNATFSIWPEHGHFTWTASDDLIEVFDFFARPSVPQS